MISESLSLLTRPRASTKLVVLAILAQRMRFQPHHQVQYDSHAIARYYYPFSTDVSITGISSFTITVTNGRTSTTYDNGGHGYPMQDTAFYLASSASISASEVATISVAVSILLL